MTTGLPTILPRKLLFGNPQRSNPTISPNGERLAFLAPDEDDILQVWILTLGADLSAAERVTKDRKRGVRSYSWSEDSATILYVQDSDGDENWHVFAVDLASGVTRDMTPVLGAQATILKGHRDTPRQLLVTMNARNPQLHDVYRLDLDTGALVLDTENPGDVVGWLADEAMQVRGCQASTAEGGFEIRARAHLDADWETLLTVGSEDADTHIVAFTGDGAGLYLVSCVGSETLRLVQIDIVSGAETVLFKDEGSDVQSVLLHRETRLPQAVSAGRLRQSWTALAEEVEGDLEAIAKLHHGDPLIVSRDASDRRWLVAFTTDDGPIPYYLYERGTKVGEQLFTSRPELEGFTLASMRGVEIPARDGLKLPSYLSLPPGVPAEGLPLVLIVHGGPWVRDHWGYDPEAQWLANRGYAVLQVNYRGSTGFGKAFVNAGDREWGAKMQDDLTDAVGWAVSEGIADPARVAIYGGSYGGYAALAGATFTPELYRCAVDVVGPSSLETLINSFPPYWEPLKKMFEKRVGAADDLEFLRARSPLHHVDAIRIPLLIAQGANDPRVKQAESEQIVEAVRAKGKEVEYLLFEDEGHGFARPQNRMTFYAAAERFLARHLGGRCEAEAPEA